MKRINCKDSSFIIFIIIAILYAIGNFIWWETNTPIIPDNISGLHFYDIFRNGFLYYNAPLITWIMKILFFLFGKEYFDLQIIVMNYVFFLIGLFFMYKIGKELKDKLTGNISMILFSLTPAVYINSVHYGHMDWHVMIAMIVNIYCLIKTNCFRDRKWSILYGISVGFGLLIKDEFLACFFVPWVYVVIKNLIGILEKSKIINIFITVIIGALIAGCHYFRLAIFVKIARDPIIETTPVFSFESLRITTVGLSEYLLSPPIFILFIIGLIYFIYKYKSQNKWIILLWFIVPWLIITFMPHKKLAEYYLCFVPALIIITSVFLGSIKNYYLLIVLCVICLLQYIPLLYGVDIPFLEKKYKDIKYYDISVFEGLSLRNKEEIEFYMKLMKVIGSEVLSNRQILLDATEIKQGAFNSLINIYLSKSVEVLNLYSIYGNLFDIFIFSDTGGYLFIDTLDVVEGEYRIYRDAPIRSNEFKRKYINKRVKEVEEIRNLVEKDYVLSDTVQYNDSVIKIYKRNPDNMYAL